jgi:hypothetical protein
MATQNRSSLIPILQAIQTQLMSTTSFPLERVNIVATWPKDPQIVGDQDLLIRPLGFICNLEEGAQGAGRVETLIHRRLAIKVRTRLAYDSEQDQVGWLTDATLGHLQLEEQVLDSLQNFIPMDGSSNWLVAQPLQLVGGDQPEDPEGLDGNGESVVYFDLAYLPALNQSVI